MAAREGGGHPFNWFIIGFVVGVAATLAAMIYLNGRREHAAAEPDVQAPAHAAAPAPAAIPALPPAPPPSAKKPAPPVEDHAQASQRELDEQMAEDAAAAGMTSRTRPGQAPPNQP